MVTILMDFFHGFNQVDWTLVFYKDCSSKFRSKHSMYQHSTNTVLCLLRNLLEQSLSFVMTL